MKSKITGIIMMLGVFVTLSLLLYPTVSDYVNSRNQSRAVMYYLDDVVNTNEQNIESMLSDAGRYNEDLLGRQNRFDFTSEETAEYERLLETGRGVMGILVIDKMDIKLPIYHGTDRAVLQVGLGHLQGSSLPVGGVGTHCVITGHQGLPSSKLLTGLDGMARGDVFVLYILNETLTYSVDLIQVVEPDEVKALKIDPGRDYVTLVTCTPYGVNTHRLLVRGHRVENAPNYGRMTSEAKLLEKALIILMFMAPALPALIIYSLLRLRRIRRRGMIYQ